MAPLSQSDGTEQKHRILSPPHDTARGRAEAFGKQVCPPPKPFSPPCPRSLRPPGLQDLFQ